MGVIKFHHPVYPCKSLRRNYNDTHIPRSNHRRRRHGLLHRILPRKSRHQLHHHRKRRHRNSGIRLQRRRTQSTARRGHTLAPSATSPPVSFSMHADLAQTLEDESGVAYHHKTIAFVTVAFDDSDIPAMQETHDIFDAADGFNAHWLDASDLREMEPRLNPEAQRGIYAYGNAILSGYEYTLGPRTPPQSATARRYGKAKQLDCRQMATA